MSIILSMALLLASADQPPATTVPSAPANTPTQTASTTTTEQPKMVCKFEYETGSRTKRVKICRAANEPQGPDSKLQRDLEKHGDFIEAPSTFGN